ncbi:MAG: OmpA family protein [Myxococcota bacterium]
MLRRLGCWLTSALHPRGGAAALWVATWVSILPLALPAAAQETRVDLHGLLPAAPTGDAAQGLTVWSPPPLARAWAFHALGEVGVQPLALEVTTYNRQEYYTILSQVAGVNLSGWVSPVPRLGLALTVPVFARVATGDLPQVAADYLTPGTLGDGAALGTVRAALTIAVAGTPTGRGFGLALVPWVAAPGAGHPLATDRAPSLGGLLTTGYRADRVALAAQIGSSFGPGGTLGPLLVRGRWEAEAGASLGLRTVGQTWAHAELRTRTNVLAGGDAAPAPLVELLGSVTARFGRAPPADAADEGPPGGPVWAGASGGSHLGQGPGAALFRGFVGVGAAGAFGSSGARRAEPEIPEFTFQVVDPHGPVRGAEVVVGDRVAATTGAGGEAVVQGEIPWEDGVQVRTDRHEPVTVPKPARGQTSRTVELAFRPVPVRATVTDLEGQPVEATLALTPVDGGDEVRGAPGEVRVVPGRYRVAVEAPGLATQVREIDVPRTGTPPAPLDVVMAPAAGDGALGMRILDPEGQPVVGARVLVEGVPVGLTADGGWIELRGLPEGVRQVEVQHPAFTAMVDVMGIDAEPGAAEVVMNRVPGSVRVRARTPDGAVVSDATVRFIGPARLAAAALGPDGERTMVLSPGHWTAIVSSPTLGVQERDVDVEEGRFELIRVDVVFREVAPGTAELGVRVVDPSGAPIEGAEVTVDGGAVGTTSTAGTVRVRGLQPGPLALGVDGPDLEPVSRSLTLLPGLQEELVAVAFREGTVDVTVRGPDGPAPDATVRFVGDEVLPPLPLGPTGRVRTQVPPGDWTVVATSTDLGVQERAVRVPAGPGALARVAFVLVPVEGGVASLTVSAEDADGAPIGQAVVLVGGVQVGATANAGTVRLTGLDVGRREVEVRATGYQPATERIRLLEGDQDLQVVLQASTGIAVRVHHDEAPVADATVRALGPEMGPPTPVDPSGRAQLPVEPGFWLALVSSPTMGVAQQDVEVGSHGYTPVDVALHPPDTGRTDLVVTVIDPIGDAVEHARVWLDDATVDQTAQGGTVMVRGLSPGPASMRVEAPDFVPSEPLPVQLVPGVSHYTVRLAWAAVPVVVRVVDDAGKPVDAEVQWTGGPLDVAAIRSGADGLAETSLRPGDWRVFVTADGVDGAAALSLALGDTPRPVQVVLSPTNARMAGDVVRIAEHVQFDFAKATLRDDSGPLLDQVARVVQAHPEIVTVEVQGHTDNVGTVAANQALSQARADAVLAALVARGVPPEKLTARGYGPTRPVAANDSDEGRAENRRVQFVVLERGVE